jgi:predicted O-methyltransferase YrrM
MKFSIERVKELVDDAMQEPYTGDDWLDTRYLEDISIVAHTNPYYRHIYLVAKEFKPEFSVELGTYRGVWSGHVAIGNPDGHVYAIDWHRDAVDKKHQKKAIAMGEHYSNMDYINGCSWDDAVVARVAAMSPIDILFIDAWHWYCHAIREWYLYSPMLSDEALVICDDISDNPGSTVDMVKFWHEVCDGYKYFEDTQMHVAVKMGFFRFVR